ncbi:zinc knuckle CX2CX4HX4C containing protein [Tanacetum coccineum]
MLSLGMCFYVCKMGRGGKGTGKRTRSSKRLNGDQALTNYVEPTVMEEVSQPNIVHSFLMNGECFNGDNNMEDVFVHETTSNVISSFGADKSNEYIVVSLFGVPHSSIEDLDVLTRKNEAGDYNELKKGMTSVEWDAAMVAIEAEWKKLLADVTSTTNVLTNEGTGPKQDTQIVKLVSFTKLVSYVEASGASSLKPSNGKANFHHLVSDNMFDGVQLSIPMNGVQTVSSRLENTLYSYFIGKRIAFLVVELRRCSESGSWMIRNSPIILKKLTMNTRPCKEELTLIPVWVKIHDVPIQVFSENGISLIASQIADEALKDSITRDAMTIPTVMNNDGFQIVVTKKKSGKTGSTVVKTTWQPINQKVRFGPKSHGNPQKAKDGNIMHSISKEKPSKAANVPSSSFSHGTTKNGCLQYHSSTSNIYMSNPYDTLDDMESDEEVEVVYDETTNLFGNNITRATYTASDASNT